MCFIVLNKPHFSAYRIFPKGSCEFSLGVSFLTPLKIPSVVGPRMSLSFFFFKFTLDFLIRFFSEVPSGVSAVTIADISHGIKQYSGYSWRTPENLLEKSLEELLQNFAKKQLQRYSEKPRGEIPKGT